MLTVKPFLLGNKLHSNTVQLHRSPTSSPMFVLVFRECEKLLVQSGMEAVGPGKSQHSYPGTYWHQQLLIKFESYESRDMLCWPTNQKDLHFSDIRFEKLYLESRFLWLSTNKQYSLYSYSYCYCYSFSYTCSCCYSYILLTLRRVCTMEYNFTGKYGNYNENRQMNTNINTLTHYPVQIICQELMQLLLPERMKRHFFLFF